MAFCCSETLETTEGQALAGSDASSSFSPAWAKARSASRTPVFSESAPGATPDLSAYATKQYVDQAIAALDDLSEVEF